MSFDTPWAGFYKSVGSGGTLTFFANRNAVRCSAPVGTRAFLGYRIDAIPGMTVEVSFFARATSNAGAADGPNFIMDWPASANPIIVQRYTSEWEEYRFSYTVPLTSTEEDYVQFSFGVFTARAGEVEITRPIFRSQFGPLPIGTAHWHNFEDADFITGGENISIDYYRYKLEGRTCFIQGRIEAGGGGGGSSDVIRLTLPFPVRSFASGGFTIGSANWRSSGTIENRRPATAMTNTEGVHLNFVSENGLINADDLTTTNGEVSWSAFYEADFS